MEILRAPRKPRKKAGFLVGVGGGIAALAIACGGGERTTVIFFDR